MADENNENSDARPASGALASSGIMRELLMSLLPVLSALVGCVVAWFTCTWAVQTFRDVFGVPGLSPVPVRDRAPGVPGPTAGYWLSWAVPLGMVYVVGALVLGMVRRGRFQVGAAIVGYSIVLIFLVPLWISIEVGGFAPT